MTTEKSNNTVGRGRFFAVVARAEGSSVEWKIDMFYWSYIEHSNWQLAIVSENTFNRCSPIHGIGNVYS